MTKTTPNKEEQPSREALLKFVERVSREKSMLATQTETLSLSADTLILARLITECSGVGRRAEL